MEARNLFRRSAPLSTFWRNEFRAPKKSEMRPQAHKRTAPKFIFEIRADSANNSRSLCCEL
jgi:hypothetical protein